LKVNGVLISWGNDGLALFYKPHHLPKSHKKKFKLVIKHLESNKHKRAGPNESAHHAGAWTSDSDLMNRLRWIMANL